MPEEIILQVNYDTIIIGGGASGMMAAIFASKNGSVLLLEKNANLGKKLKITGGTRCNIFNCEYDTNKLLKFYGDAEKYLRTSFAKFGLEETEKFFLDLGIEVKIEDRKRAFPKSEKAEDVYSALFNELIKNKVEIKYNSTVEKIYFSEKADKRISGVKIKNQEEVFAAKKYILSTGGYSHPETGSTGDGFKLLAEQNIKINAALPSLVPLAVSTNWVKKLSGRTIENLKMTFFVDGIKKKILKTTYKENIETKNRILFTHFGLSGPTILNNSKFVSDWLAEGEVTLSLDLFPSHDEGQLNNFLLSIFEKNKNKIFKNILNDIYPGNILETIFEDHIILKNILQKQVNDIRVEERKLIRETLKNIIINITALMGFEKAIIASGGVDISEVNFSNMNLKKIENLYITGDMLDINRPSGGFSLQLCWTTGFLAGSNH